MSGAIFEIGGTTAALQAELAKIPGMTDRAAAAAAVKLSAPLIKAQKEAGAAAEKAAKQAADAWLDALAAEVKAEEEVARAAAAAQAAADRAAGEAAAKAASVQAAKAAEAAAWRATVAETEHYAAGTLGATRNAERSVKITGAQAASLKNLGSQLADVGKGLALGQSPFTIAAQQGDQLLGALAGLGGILPTVGAVAAGVAGLAAVLGTAYVVSAASASETSAEAAARLDTAAAAAKGTKEEVEALTKAWADFVGDSAAIQARIDVINGKLTENQAKAKSEAAKLTEEARKSIKADADRYAALIVLAQAEEKVASDTHASVKEIVAAAAASKQHRAEAAALKKTIDEHKAALAGSVELLDMEAEYLDLSSDAKDRNKAATDALKKAEEELNRRQIEEWRAIDLLLDKQDAYRRGIQALAEAGTKAAHDRQQAEREYYAWKDAQEKKALAEAKKANEGLHDVADTMREIAGIGGVSPFASSAIADITSFAADMKDLNAEIQHGAIDAAQYKSEVVKLAGSLGSALAGAAADALGARAQAAVDVAQATVDAAAAIHDQLQALTDSEIDAASLTGQALYDAYTQGAVGVADLSDAQKKALEARLAAEEAAANQQAELAKQGAIEAFNAQKAASMAQAGVLGLQAVLQSLAAAPFPINAGLAAATLALVGAQEKAIAAQPPPSFRAGGEVPSRRAGGAVAGAYPDVVPISAEAGEGLLTRQGMSNRGGPEGLRRQNAGMSPGSGSLGPLTVNLVLRGKVAAQIVLEGLEDAGVRAAVARAVRPTLNPGLR